MRASVVAVSGLSSVVHRLSCSVACGIFPDQGSNPGLLHWRADSLTTEPPWKPCPGSRSFPISCPHASRTLVCSVFCAQNTARSAVDIHSLNEEWMKLGRAWTCRAGAPVPGTPSSSLPYDGSSGVSASLSAAPTQVSTRARARHSETPKAPRWVATWHPQSPLSACQPSVHLSWLSSHVTTSRKESLISSWSVAPLGPHGPTTL